VSIPSFGQSWNPYSYVLNNPLGYVDPGGFQEALPEAGARSPLPAGAEFRWEVIDLPPIGLNLIVRPVPEVEARSDADMNIVAAETGGAMPPIDVSTTGSASGYVPQPVSTAPEHTGAGTVVGQSLLGAAEGTVELAAGVARSLALNALTLGGYGAYELGSAMRRGYEEDGILGALNAVNPLYHIGRGAADTALAIDGEDYRAAGAAGTKTVLLGAATVFGAGKGLGTLAEQSAAVGSARVGTYGGLRAAGVKDAHHVIQDAAVRELPGYSRSAAPAVELPGPSTRVGTSHYAATQVQRQAGGGTYGAERRIGYKALRRAGQSPGDARALIEQADSYFQSIGVTSTTPTRIPGSR
ncbi:hypothetical protein BE21_09625, partial [Sorangium cellulosum]